MNVYLYRFHLSGEYDVCLNPFDGEDLLCTDCMDADELVYEFDTLDYTTDENETLYIYESCCGGFYASAIKYDLEELYCKSCNQYEGFILEFKLSDLKGGW